MKDNLKLELNEIQKYLQLQYESMDSLKESARSTLNISSLIITLISLTLNRFEDFSNNLLLLCFILFFIIALLCLIIMRTTKNDLSNTF